MRKSKKIILYSAFALIFVLCLIIYVTTSPKGDVVTIKSDGKIIEQVDLKTVSDEYEMQVNHNGYNKIKITKNGVGVFDADCPDKLCINQSETGTYPIICLPHKLVIEKTDSK